VKAFSEERVVAGPEAPEAWVGGGGPGSTCSCWTEGKEALQSPVRGTSLASCPASTPWEPRVLQVLDKFLNPKTYR
jgi:hypothetical protein